MLLIDAENSVRELMAREVLGNTVEEWTVALAVLLATFLGLGVVKRVVQHHFARLAAKTETQLDDLLVDVIKRTKRWFLFVVAVYVASHFIHLPPTDADLDGKPDPVSRYELWFEHAAKIALWLQVGLWGRGLVHFGLQRLVAGKSADDPARTMGVAVLGFIGQLIVWTLVLLLCLEAIGFPVTSLIASLGVGGIAVALAAQNILGDLFASITILLDKPFVVGDGIQFGDFNGSIERIGVKTTRLRSVNGEEIIVGNQDLVSSRIRNFKRLSERRITMSIGVDYATPHQAVQAIPSMLKEIVTAQPKARFDRAHLKTLGASALEYELVFFSVSSDYVDLMNLQQAVNFAVHARFEAEGIRFAFPTQTLYVERPARPRKAADPERGATMTVTRAP